MSPLFILYFVIVFICFEVISVGFYGWVIVYLKVDAKIRVLFTRASFVLIVLRSGLYKQEVDHVYIFTFLKKKKNAVHSFYQLIQRILVREKTIFP